MTRPVDIISSGRLESVEKKCPCCGKDATVFRDALSYKESQISGLCQECQDIVFDGPEE